MTDSLQLIVILHLIAGAVCLDVIQEADPAESSNDDALVSVKENIKQNASGDVISEAILTIINAILNEITGSTTFKLTDGYYTVSDWEQSVDLQIYLTEFVAEEIEGAKIEKLKFCTANSAINTKLYVKSVTLKASYALNNWLWNVQYENVPGTLKIKLENLYIEFTENIKLNAKTEHIDVTYFKIDEYTVHSVRSHWSSFQDKSFNEFFDQYVKDKRNSIIWAINEAVKASPGCPTIWFERISELISAYDTVSASI